MKKYSNDKNINKKVSLLIKSGWSVKKGKKHAKAISPTGQFVVIPSTPSDHKAWLNFSHDIKRTICKELPTNVF